MLLSDECIVRLNDSVLPDGFWGLCVKGLGLFFRNIIPIVFITVIIFLPAELIASFFIYQFDRQNDMMQGMRISNIVFLVAGSLTAPAICFLIVHSLSGAPVSARKAIAFGFRRFFLVLVTSFASNLLIGLGCIFFIIPGVIIYSWYALVTPVAALDETPHVGVLERSKQLTAGFRGRFIMLGLGLFLVIISAAIVISFLPYLGLSVLFGDTWWIDGTATVFGDLALQIFPAVMTVFYVKMTRQKEHAPEKQPLT